MRLSRRPWLVPVIVLAVVVIGWSVVAVRNRDDVDTPPDGAAPPSAARDRADDPIEQTTTTLTPLGSYDGWVDPASSGHPYGTTVSGLLTFRGNPTRSWYGTGPMPTNPQILWTFPPGDGGLCGLSSENGVVNNWCGTGWTGQPSVWQNPDGKTWVAFGAFDYAVHWLDFDNGTRVLPDFKTGDLIKGSVTVDPDGYPLLYTGSRDADFHIIAMDRAEPTQLWTLNAKAVSPTLWNNDWDGSALVIDDYLFEGGENSQFHIVKLNRGYDADGKVTVDPQLVFHAPGWDDTQLADITDKQVSIENSVAISGNTVYFANSGGLVQGWDITGLKDGVTPRRVFRFWTGDDTDASIVVDADGFLYVASEYERHNARSTTVGQIMKLDPTKPDDPLVWSVDDQGPNKQGVWATPAIWQNMVYVATNGGRLLGLDRATGALVWEKHLGSQTWQSPVVVDDVLLEGDCGGVLHAYDVSDRQVDPPELWHVQLEGCIESTPAVWNGRIFVGSRGGSFYAIGDVTS